MKQEKNETKENWLTKIKRFFKTGSFKDKFKDVPSITLIQWGDDSMPSDKIMNEFKNLFEKINSDVFNNPKKYNIIDTQDVNDEMYVVNSYQYIIDKKANIDQIWKEVVNNFSNSVAKINSELFSDLSVQHVKDTYINDKDFDRDEYTCWIVRTDSVYGNNATSMITLELVKQKM